MRWSIPLVVLLVGAFAEDNEPAPRPVGVVYLISVLNEPRYEPEAVETGISNDIPEENVKAKTQPGFLLIQAIPETEALSDGVYFRPADGKPLENPEVSRRTLLEEIVQ
jgi:hypothetical protein